LRCAEKAEKELADLGDTAEPALRAALSSNHSAESRRRTHALLERLALSSDRLRQLRAIEVLEQIGSTAAQRLLTDLSTGAEQDRLTREAKTALRRIEQRARLQ